VLRWAEEVIEYDEAPPAAFFDLVSVPAADLSELRHALFPLVVEPPGEPALRAVLNLVRTDLIERRRNLEDTMTVLRQMRSMLTLPPVMYASLNDAFVAHAAETGASTALVGWLDRFARDSSAL
jgi:hypothetical protein